MKCSDEEWKGAEEVAGQWGVRCVVGRSHGLGKLGEQRGLGMSWDGELSRLGLSLL